MLNAISHTINIIQIEMTWYDKWDTIPNLTPEKMKWKQAQLNLDQATVLAND